MKAKKTNECFGGYLSGKILNTYFPDIRLDYSKKIEAAILFEVIPRIIIAALFCKSFSGLFYWNLIYTVLVASPFKLCGEELCQNHVRLFSTDEATRHYQDISVIVLTS